MFKDPPRQIHQNQCRRDGGQEAEDIILFSQQMGERRRDDIAVGVVQKIEVRAQGLVEKIDGQGRAEQERQHLRDPEDAGAVAAHDQQNGIQHQKCVDGDGVQIDEGPPRGNIPLAGTEQRQRGPRDAERVQLFFAPVLVKERVVQADEHVDAAQVQG